MGIRSLCGADSPGAYKLCREKGGPTLLSLVEGFSGHPNPQSLWAFREFCQACKCMTPSRVLSQDNGEQMNLAVRGMPWNAKPEGRCARRCLPRTGFWMTLQGDSLYLFASSHRPRFPLQNAACTCRGLVGLTMTPRNKKCIHFAVPI